MTALLEWESTRPRRSRTESEAKDTEREMEEGDRGDARPEKRRASEVLFCEIRFVCPPVLSQLDPEGRRRRSLNGSEGGSGIGFGRGRPYMYCTALLGTMRTSRTALWSGNERGTRPAAMRRESDNGVRSASVCRQIQMQGWMDGCTAPPLSLAFLAASLRVMGQAAMNLRKQIRIAKPCEFETCSALTKSIKGTQIVLPLSNDHCAERSPYKGRMASRESN